MPSTTYTTDDTFTVPQGVWRLSYVVNGSAGATPFPGGSGGNGITITGTRAVTAGDIFYLRFFAGGTSTNAGNGGKGAGIYAGADDIANAFVIAGGGGGGGRSVEFEGGGAGGAASSTNGGTGQPTAGTRSGRGATTSAVGAGGTGGAGADGSAGSGRTGGNGGSGGGAGGGGRFGGGGGEGDSGDSVGGTGGGAGSSLTPSDATTAANTGSASIVLTYSVTGVPPVVY